MDKKQLKELLENDDLKKYTFNHFLLKAYDVVIERYGGEIEEWYYGEPEKEDNDNDGEDNKNKKEIHLVRVQNNRIDEITVICEFDKAENQKIISLYKSTIPFKSISSINVSSDIINVSTSKKIFNYAHLNILTIPGENYEKFHKVLIRKFDAYCDVEYNHLLRKINEMDIL